MSVPSFNFTVLFEDEFLSQAAKVVHPPLALNPAGYTLGAPIILHPSVKNLDFSKKMHLLAAKSAKHLLVKLEGLFNMTIGDLTVEVGYESRVPLPLCWCETANLCNFTEFCPDFQPADDAEVEAANFDEDWDDWVDDDDWL